MKFRKKPVVIDAEQFFPDKARPKGVCDCSPDGEFTSPHVHTLEGTSYGLQDGDWVIRGVHGEYYLCKPDIFAETYELAE